MHRSIPETLLALLSSLVFTGLVKVVKGFALPIRAIHRPYHPGQGSLDRITVLQLQLVVASHGGPVLPR